jgi:hypothetical protein
VPSRFVVAAVLTLALGAASAALSCGGSTPVQAVDAAAVDVTLLGGIDAPLAIDSGQDASPLQTNLRVALVSELRLGIDICVRPGITNGTFEGPLLFDLPTLPDAGEDAHKTPPLEASVKPDAASDAKSASDAGHSSDAARESSTTTDASDGAPPHDSGRVEDADATKPHDGAHDSLESDAREEASEAAADAAPDAPRGVDGGVRSGGVHGFQVSSYLSVQGAGTFEVKIVPGGSPSCGAAAEPLAIQYVTMNAGAYYTLVVHGSLPPLQVDAGVDAGPRSDAESHDAKAHDAKPGDATAGDARIDATHPEGGHADDAAREGSSTEAGVADAGALPLSFIILTDEPALSTTLARARFVNMLTGSSGAAGPLSIAAIDDVSGGTPVSTLLASDVPDLSAARPNPAAPAVDTLGYWSGPPISFASSIFASASQDAGPAGAVDAVAPQYAWSFELSTSFPSFDINQGSNHTGFIVGGGTTPPALLWCNDSEQSASALTACTLSSGP